MRDNGGEDNGSCPNPMIHSKNDEDLSMRTRIILTILHTSTCDIMEVDEEHIIFMHELGYLMNCLIQFYFLHISTSKICIPYVNTLLSWTPITYI
jgi:hypothetical protein